MTPEPSPLELLELSIATTMQAVEPAQCYRICHVTAALGCYALRAITGDKWGCSAGSVWACLYPNGAILPGGDAPLFMEVDAEHPDNAAAIEAGGTVEFHAWTMFTDLPPGTQIGPEQDDRVLLIDFSTRYWRQLCAEHDLPLHRSFPSPALGSPQSLKVRQGISFHSSAKIGLQVMADAMGHLPRFVPLWQSLAAHYGFKNPGFKQALRQDIEQRLQVERAALQSQSTASSRQR